jgi:excisionase family DNA binding protein
MTNRLLYSRAEAARLLGISLRTIDRLLSDGRIPSSSAGRRRLISRDSLLNFAGQSVRNRLDD